jgi:eukaryotic-like serine/threonine-protein kinase
MQRWTTGRLEIGLATTGRDAEVTFEGGIDERTQLVDFARRLGADRITIDLAQVTFINSVGVREWVSMLRALQERSVAVVLRGCSEVMIMQLNMIDDAQGTASVESFFAPYVCDACGAEATVRIELAAHRDALRRMEPPPFPCTECGATMEFNEIPERYFHFVIR